MHLASSQSTRAFIVLLNRIALLTRLTARVYDGSGTRPYDISLGSRFLGKLALIRDVQTQGSLEETPHPADRMPHVCGWGRRPR